MWLALARLALTLAALPLGSPDAVGSGTTVSLDVSPAGQRQTIDGFGAHQGSDTNVSATDWFRKLFFEDMQCSIYRVDLSPSLRSPWSDLGYNSPNFGEKGAMALPSPDKNNVRT